MLFSGVFGLATTLLPSAYLLDLNIPLITCTLFRVHCKSILVFVIEESTRLGEYKSLLRVSFFISRLLKTALSSWFLPAGAS